MTDTMLHDSPPPSYWSDTFYSYVYMHPNNLLVTGLMARSD